MDFSKRQADPRRHLVGLTFVILFHAFIVYALVTGLATKVVDVVRAPIETKVIEEIKKPPPPPEVVVPPPPRLEAPTPPYIPPPEVQIATPPPPAPTITVAPSPTPPAPVAIVPVAPPAAPPAAPGPVAASVACPNYKSVLIGLGFPAEAQRRNIQRGTVTLQFTVAANGSIKDVTVVHASNPVFARVGISAVGDFKCLGVGHDVQVQVPIDFKLVE